MADVANRFNPEEADNVTAAIGEFKRRKTSLYRAYNKKYPVVRTLQELQNYAQLQTSLEGVPLILHSDVQLNLLVLATEHDLSLLHGSEVWVGDGNFDYRPILFAQLYTLHGFYAGEAKAAVHILMPDRTVATYTDVLERIRQALLARHGSIGNIDGNSTHSQFNSFTVLLF
ncbi:MAG: hypothetical protein GY847_32325 [Proteobacteria bacterium]|nr:hypothetical protein [Pseudomonadota bacterium]